MVSVPAVGNSQRFSSSQRFGVGLMELHHFAHYGIIMLSQNAVMI